MQDDMVITIGKAVGILTVYALFFALVFAGLKFGGLL